MTNEEIFAEIAKDFESSDYGTRYENLTEILNDAEYMTDEEIFTEIAQDFESSDYGTRYPITFEETVYFFEPKFKTENVII